VFQPRFKIKKREIKLFKIILYCLKYCGHIRIDDESSICEREKKTQRDK
jgi:hypothetical protein